MNQNQGTNPQQLIDKLKESWGHPVIPRSLVGEATGHLVSPKSLANVDSMGRGPEGRFLVNGKVVYPTESLIDWLKQRIEKRGRNHDNQKATS